MELKKKKKKETPKKQKPRSKLATHTDEIVQGQVIKAGVTNVSGIRWM